MLAAKLVATVLLTLVTAKVLPAEDTGTPEPLDPLFGHSPDGRPWEDTITDNHGKPWPKPPRPNPCTIQCIRAPCTVAGWQCCPDGKTVCPASAACVVARKGYRCCAQGKKCPRDLD